MSVALSFGPDTGRRELWLFTLSVSNDDLGYWEPPRPNGPPREWALEDMLSVGPLDPSHVFVFEAGDLGKHGLRHYLVDAHGMDPAEIEADADRLDRIHGTTVVLLSGALTQRPGQFTVEPPLWYIGHYGADYDLTPAAPAHPRAATEGHIPGPAGPAADRQKLARLAGWTIAALAVLAAAIWALP